MKCETELTKANFLTQKNLSFKKVTIDEYGFEVFKRTSHLGSD